MKHLYYTLLLLLPLLAACSEDPVTLPDPVGPPSGEELQIRVRVADFVPAGGSDTRAEDSGKQTFFEPGDRIGVTIFDGSGERFADNIPYVYDGETWIFDRNNDEGKKPYYPDNRYVTYVAYFPYGKDADGIYTPWKLEEKFPPRADQRTEENYRASDLMTWASQPQMDKKVIDINLRHAYASVSFCPTAQCLFDDTEDTPIRFPLEISGVSLSVGNEFGLQPYYNATDGSYRYILPAGARDVQFYYTVNRKTSRIALPQSLNANTRYTLEPEILDKRFTYTLSDAKTGDFYCRRSDNGKGFLIPGDLDTETYPEFRRLLADVCVGIVFWAGDATAQDPTLRKDHPTCTHGLAVAIKNPNPFMLYDTWQSTGASVQDWLDSHCPGEYLPVASGTGAADPINNVQGYNNTKAIEAFNDAMKIVDTYYSVLPVSRIVDYRKQVAAPVNSSDWYLPSIKELSLLCAGEADDIWNNKATLGTANRDLLLGPAGPFEKLGEDAPPLIWVYHSSTEQNAERCYYYNFDVHGELNWGYKDDFKDFRGVLAF